MNTYDVVFVRRVIGIGVLPCFGNNAPFLQPHQPVPLALLQSDTLAYLVVFHFSLFVGEAGGDPKRPLHHLPNFGAAAVALPREPLVRSHEQYLGTQLARYTQPVDRQTVKKSGSKLLSLVFVDDEKATPRPRRVFPSNSEALLLQPYP